MTAFARSPVRPEATLLGVLSARLRRPRTRSVTTASRRFETSFKRLKCANTGHCPRARRMGQFDRGRVKSRGKNATDRATENFRDFSTSDRPQTSKTDQDHQRVKTPRSFHTASPHSYPSRQALRTGGERERADFGGRRRLRERPGGSSSDHPAAVRLPSRSPLRPRPSPSRASRSRRPVRRLPARRVICVTAPT
jgi:hypothetical protein